MKHISFINILCETNHSHDLTHCEVCQKGKQQREHFSFYENKYISIFELLHIDVWGPYTIYTSTKTPYFLTIVDDHSRATWLFLMQYKSQVPQLLRNFCKFTQNQFQKNIKIIMSDNGTEFTCHDTQALFKEQGIVHQ